MASNTSRAGFQGRPRLSGRTTGRGINGSTTSHCASESSIRSLDQTLCAMSITITTTITTTSTSASATTSTEVCETASSGIRPSVVVNKTPIAVR